jgi:radical SAM protein with 4Fe4S-binding SPASM domain
LSQLKKIFYHRASIEGKHMLAVGSCDGRYACQGHVAITASGDVVPCLFLRDRPAGNIYDENIGTIIKKSKKSLLLQHAVKGDCASCCFGKYCIGCRANALLYSGDINAADPKCFFNKDAPEFCLSSGMTRR